MASVSAARLDFLCYWFMPDDTLVLSAILSHLFLFWEEIPNRNMFLGNLGQVEMKRKRWMESF